jgi:hypothetical protein
MMDPTELGRSRSMLTDAHLDDIENQLAAESIARRHSTIDSQSNPCISGDVDDLETAEEVDDPSTTQQTVFRNLMLWLQSSGSMKSLHDDRSPDLQDTVDDSRRARSNTLTKMMGWVFQPTESPVDGDNESSIRQETRGRSGTMTKMMNWFQVNSLSSVSSGAAAEDSATEESKADNVMSSDIGARYLQERNGKKPPEPSRPISTASPDTVKFSNIHRDVSLGSVQCEEVTFSDRDSLLPHINDLSHNSNHKYDKGQLYSSLHSEASPTTDSATSTIVVTSDHLSVVSEPTAINAADAGTLNEAPAAGILESFQGHTADLTISKRNSQSAGSDLPNRDGEDDDDSDIFSTQGTYFGDGSSTPSRFERVSGTQTVLHQTTSDPHDHQHHHNHHHEHGHTDIERQDSCAASGGRSRRGTVTSIVGWLQTSLALDHASSKNFDNSLDAEETVRNALLSLLDDEVFTVARNLAHEVGFTINSHPFM